MTGHATLLPTRTEREWATFVGGFSIFVYRVNGLTRYGYPFRSAWIHAPAKAVYRINVTCKYQGNGQSDGY